MSIKFDDLNYTPFFFSNRSARRIYVVFYFLVFLFVFFLLTPSDRRHVITTIPSTPSSTAAGRASARPNKNGALPSTHHQIPSYVAVLLSSTIGIITYAFLAAL